MLAEAAAAHGINISPLTPLHLGRSRQPGLLAGFGRLPEHKIPAAVVALATVLAEARALPPPSEQRRERPSGTGALRPHGLVVNPRPGDHG
jgi:hypothetical protein